METLLTLVPDVEVLLALAPEELARILPKTCAQLRSEPHVSAGFNHIYVV